MTSILLLGCGHMGQAMLKGWLADALNAEIMVVDPKADQLAAQYSGNHIRFYNNPNDLPGRADWLVLAIKPQKFAEILPLYKDRLNSGAGVLSVAAGVRIDKITQLLQNPDLPVVRAMPNLPAMIGQGVTVAFANTLVGAERKQSAQELLQSLGELIWSDREDVMNAVTALSGSGPAYVFALCEAMAAAGVKQGLNPNMALQLARHTIIGSAAMLQISPLPPSALRAQVTSKGGTTEAALDILLQDGGLNDLFARAIENAANRAKKLAEQV